MTHDPGVRVSAVGETVRAVPRCGDHGGGLERTTYAASGSPVFA